MENTEDKSEPEEISKKSLIPKLSKAKNFPKKCKQNPWIVSTLILGVFLSILLFVGNFAGGITGKVISEEEAANIILDLVEEQVGDAELVDVNQENGLYQVTFSSEGEESSVYITLDGENLINGLIPLILLQQEQEIEEQESEEIPKSDKPSVELFVMTHCPYGTQAEKGMIPVIEEIGNLIDVKIRFVHYFMHEPEETETPRQVCIREEQSDKFLNYLKCFLEDGDFDRCLIEVGIDKNKLNNCISNGNADEYYAEDSTLSNSYGVGGSPSLVINGVQVDSGRSPAAYLTTICEAFNDIPNECSLELSSTTPSPMWGWEDSGDSTTATC